LKVENASKILVEQPTTKKFVGVKEINTPPPGANSIYVLLIIGCSAALLFLRMGKCFVKK